MAATDLVDDARAGALVAQAHQVVAHAMTAVDAYDRHDLLPRLDEAAARLSQPDLTVVVVGEFKQGKSTLIDALLNTDICPVDDDIATAVPTLVRHGDEISAALVRTPTADAASGGRAEMQREAVAPADIARFATDADGAAAGVEAIDVRIPRKLLAQGLVLVDTPGVGGLQSQHGEATMSMLRGAHAVLFVSDTSQELTAAELDVLRRVHERCGTVALVQTKIDLYPHWRAIVELNRGHLERAGLDMALIPVASPLRTMAVAHNDAALNDESGFPALVQHLRGEVLANGERRAAEAAGRDVVEVANQLAATLEAERASLADPDHRASLLADLEQAQRRTEALAAGSARWQTTLNDGVADLNGDVDHDLRTRIRDLNAAIGERIDTVDPAKAWDEIEPWLRQQVAEQVAANFALLAERSEALAYEVAELFLEDRDEIEAAAALHGSDLILGTISTDTAVDLEVQSVLNSGLSVLRGSYGGMMMFGMIGGMFGLTLALPVTVGLGLALGGKGLGEERKRQLTQRRQQAKSVARTYVDEVNLRVSKDTRDLGRTIHRRLRDGWSQRAAELVRGAQHSLQAAQHATQVGAHEADARIADLDAELGRVAALRDRALGVVEGAVA